MIIVGLLPKESTALFSSDASGTYSWPHTPPSPEILDQSYPLPGEVVGRVCVLMAERWMS